MRDYTYPVVTGMFILGALMILAATTSANAANQETLPLVANGKQEGFYQPVVQIQAMIERETQQQIEVQRATAIYQQAEQSRALTGKNILPSCAICKID
jgi:hypothetical protein